MDLIALMRPSHWSKNLFVFAALIFGKKLFVPAEEMLIALGSAMGAFLCFSLASSAIYIFNDIVDRNVDRLHPSKRNRPIAAGRVSIGVAVVFAVVLAAVAIVGSFLIIEQFCYLILTYIVLMVLYSLLLKRMMILDCIVISVGFCLRAVAGALVVGVFISPWLIICTFALCLFLAFGKRRSEIAMLGNDKELFRKTLAGYTPELLAHMLDVTSGLAIVCFLLYAMDDRTSRIFGTNNIVYTTPFVLYCIFRFSALVQKGKFSGPVELILKDIPFQLGLLAWVIASVLVVYGEKLGLQITDMWSY